MNKNGQALVEFIIIMPIFFIIVMGIFDFGNILYQKYQLENNIDYIVDLYNNGKTNELNNYIDSKKLELVTDNSTEYITFNLSKTISINTPFINVLLGKEYSVETTKVVYEG